jgi:hypothetical protein
MAFKFAAYSELRQNSTGDKLHSVSFSSAFNHLEYGLSNCRELP